MTRERLVIHDDAVARGFEPFALTRPIGTLATGIAPIADRWSMALGLDGAHCSGAAHLADFEEELQMQRQALPAGSIVASSRFAPAYAALAADRGPSSWASGGRLVAVRLREGLKAASPDALDKLLAARPGAGAVEIDGWWHDEVWDFIRLLPTILADDIRRISSNVALAAKFGGAAPSHATILGDHPILIDPGSSVADSESTLIERHVVLDATTGPILIEAGAHIRSFTRITGPCRIGHKSTIMGGDVTGCSIGPVCKVRGEISSSILLGYSNKGHDGFVGHSYLGRWVNLGAGTTTSNLKNTYGSVALWTPTGVRDTGMQFLGTMFGDHVKTGIGMMLTTGTVLGAGANVYGSSMPPKVVSPFSWGDGEPYDVYRLDKFLGSAETMMSRRHMTLAERSKRQLAASFERRWSASLDAKTQSGRASRPEARRQGALEANKKTNKAATRASKRAGKKGGRR
ncbi:MAG TPA: putative sugar nucleotidyl transferase [Gemmatimonadaceae bacterium]